MRNVVYVAPFPLATTMRFARALASLDEVRVLGVFQESPPPGVFHDVAIVDDALSVDGIAGGVERLARQYGPIHRVLGILENIQEQLAEVRDRMGLEGVDLETARRFRDKGHMKEWLGREGLPCAAHVRLVNREQAWTFADRVGYPLVLKPPAGAGCKATWRVDSPQHLLRALDATHPSHDNPVLAEEYLTGQEWSFEVFTLNGEAVFHSACRYYPGPLEVVENPWIQWVTFFPRRLTGPGFDDPATFRSVPRRLGLQTGLSHMEWFRRPDGRRAIGEIGARPPGAQIVTSMGWVHDTDMYRAWARLMVDDAFDGPWERKYAVAACFLRGPGTGRIRAVDGLDAAQEKLGHLVVESKLPQVGAFKSDSYEGDGFVILRHEDDEVVKNAAMEVIRTVQVRYG